MKIQRIIFIFLPFLIGCKVSSAPTETAVFPTSTSQHEPMLPTPSPMTPNIDGALSPNEWVDAVTSILSDGSELMMMQADGYLYLAVRSVTPELIGANVFIENDGQVRILHTSAALGTAVYQQSETNWQQTQDFDWHCRDTSASEAAQAERAAYLKENHWLAANSRMGARNELEYQIELMGGSPRIAVSVFRSSTPNERVFWPSTLADDTIRPHPGGLPTEMYFSPEQWSAVASEP